MREGLFATLLLSGALVLSASSGNCAQNKATATRPGKGKHVDSVRSQVDSSGLTEHELFFDKLPQTVVGLLADSFKVVGEPEAGRACRESFSPAPALSRSSSDAMKCILLKARKGTISSDFQGTIFPRVVITSISFASQEQADSLCQFSFEGWNSENPRDSFPIEQIQAPPFVFVKGKTHAIVVSIRCEYVNLGIDYKQIAKGISGKFNGLVPDVFMINGCGGPLENLSPVKVLK